MTKTYNRQARKVANIASSASSLRSLNGSEDIVLWVYTVLWVMSERVIDLENMQYAEEDG